jgi:hypothetical protein
MGLSNNSSSIRPDQAPFPTGTPAELEAMGYDTAQVHSCAVGTATDVAGSTLRGCPFAKTCRTFWAGQNPKLGSFAPKALRPDTPGEGPQTVLYSLRTNDGERKEDSMACWAFMTTMWSRMLSSKDRLNPSQEKINLLGWADGQQRIVISETLPVMPGNKVNDNRMVTTTKAVAVPPHPRPQELDPTWKMRAAEDAMDDIDLATDIAASSAADMLPPDADPMAGEVLGPTTAAIAQEGPPMRRRGRDA